MRRSYVSMIVMFAMVMGLTALARAQEPSSRRSRRPASFSWARRRQST